VAEVSIGHFYLREIEITDLLTTVKVDGGKVLVKPFQLVLNGAPVDGSVDLDLGVPGYKYDVSFNAQAIPLAPLVNSFQPERKGMVGGTLVVQTKIVGAGTTGASLQKNLSGNFDFDTTNLNLSVVNLKNPMLKDLVDVIAFIPELARDPVGTTEGLVTRTFGRGSSKNGSLADELNKSPIDQIIIRGSIGSGRVEVQQALVQSPLFQAQAPGSITLDRVLSNSVIQFPVSISLSRRVAQQLNMVPANTPTNVPYVKFPDFFTMKGTLGEPKKEIDTLALGGAFFHSIGSGIGGLLHDIVPSSSGSGTNQPSGVSGAVQDVGGLFKGLFGGSKPTTPPPVKTNAPPPQKQ
jgi:hypothetical protein